MSVTEYRLCGAKAKRTGQPCRAPAMANGRCRIHGGKSTGPKNKEKWINNKRAVKTGEHEKITWNTLTDEERLILEQLPPTLEKNIDANLKLFNIRLYRMLKRLNKLEQEEMYLAEIETTTGNEAGRPVHVTKEKYQNSIEMIQRMEEAITRTQEKMVRLLDLKHRIESATSENEVQIDDFLKALRIKSEEVWKH